MYQKRGIVRENLNCWGDTYGLLYWKPGKHFAL